MLDTWCDGVSQSLLTRAALQTFIDSLTALRGDSEAAAALAGRRGHGFGAAVAALGLSNKAVFEGDVAEGGGNAGARVGLVTVTVKGTGHVGRVRRAGGP